MTDRTLPGWLRLVLVGSGLTQLGFGLTLLADPAVIAAVWPWPMTPVATRLLGASTLVSVPLSLLAARLDRWSIARIPLVMLACYRVLQLVAGLVHLDRFDLARPTTWNYFGGGALLLVAFGAALARGDRLGRPVEATPRWPGEAGLRLSGGARLTLRAVGVLFAALGASFLILGPNAAPLWIEAPGRLTPLTARLFASPMIGLAFGLWLIARASRWREVVVPAVGMTTFGLAGLAALALHAAEVAPPGPLGFVVAATPAVLLAVGLTLLGPARGPGGSAAPQPPA